MPQMPTPLTNRNADRQQEQQQQPETHREAGQPEQRGVFLVSTTVAIWSVTVPNV